MIISIIAAMDEAGVIGINNTLPWKLPSDMKWFRTHTLGKTIIMGRKTFESFGAKPLPDRQNIIVSFNPSYEAQGCDVVNSIDDAITKAQQQHEVMIIGGASFYQQTINRVDRMYLTTVHTRVTGDTWFPAFQEHDWQVHFEQHHQADEKNSLAHTFRILDRK